MLTSTNHGSNLIFDCWVTVIVDSSNIWLVRQVFTSILNATLKSSGRNATVTLFSFHLLSQPSCIYSKIFSKLWKKYIFSLNTVIIHLQIISYISTYIKVKVTLNKVDKQKFMILYWDNSSQNETYQYK